MTKHVTLLTELGRGGMGVVCEARDEESVSGLGRAVPTMNILGLHP